VTLPSWRARSPHGVESPVILLFVINFVWSTVFVREREAGNPWRSRGSPGERPQLVELAQLTTLVASRRAEEAATSEAPGCVRAAEPLIEPHN
jgi:hypothetical protein